MKKILIALFAIALLFGIVAAKIEANIVSAPFPPISQVEPLIFAVTPMCVGEPCKSEAAGFRVDYSAPGVSSASVVVERNFDQQPAQISYRCNSYYPDCNPPGAEHFTINVVALDSYGDEIDDRMIPPSPRAFDFEYTAEDNSPPIPAFDDSSLPVIENGKVKIPFFIDSTDDEILRTDIEIILDLPEVGGHSQIQFHDIQDPDWKIVRELGLVEQNEYYAALEYTCPGGDCGETAHVMINAIDPRGGKGNADYLIEPSGEDPEASVVGTYDMELRQVFATVRVSDDDIEDNWNLADMQVKVNSGGQTIVWLTKEHLDGDAPPPSGIVGGINRILQPPNTYDFSFVIDCADCVNQAIITAQVTDSDGNDAKGEAIIPIRVLAPPDMVSIVPLQPDEGEDFVLTVYQPENNEINSHIYSFYHLVYDEDLEDYVKSPIASRQEQMVNARSDKLSSVYNFECTDKEECSGIIGADIYARKGSIESVMWTMSPLVRFYVEAPHKPVLESVIPSDKFERLSKGIGEFIEPGETVTLFVGASPTGPPADKLVVSATRAGEQISDLSFEQDASLGTVQIQVDCKKLGCENREYISVAVVAVAGDKTSEPINLGLMVYDETLEEPPGVPMICETGIGESINYMAAGLLAMALVIGLVFMAGESLNIPKLLEWSKNEALQLMIVPIIFIIIIWLASTVCTLQMEEFFKWAPGLEGYYIKGNMNIMEAAQEHLYWAIGETHLTIAMVRRDMGALNMRATRNNYDNQGFGFGMNGYSHAKFSGDYTSSGTLNMLLNLNTGFILTLLFQYFSLVFFTGANGFFFALVPLGLIMRSIPYLRSFGGGMVALAVGLFVFYPIVLAMTGIILGPVYHAQDASDTYVSYYGGMSDESLVKSIRTVELSEQDMTGTGMTSYMNSYPQPIVSDSKDPNIDADIFGKRHMKNVNFSEFFILTAQNFLRAVFMPTAALIVTVAFIANLAIVFGGEIDASKLVQMV